MSDHIPFEIQIEIMKRLPVKSLVQFRSVSKQWKSFIECSEFIKKYHINHPNPQHRLLVRYTLDTLDTVRTYTSIIDDNTFPQQKFPLTAPEPLNLETYTTILGSVDGLLCFCQDDYSNNTMMVVIWNPSLRKYVGIVIPYVLNSLDNYICIGFGVCPETSDPKLVKINVVKSPSIFWEVQVFTLSLRVWKPVYKGAPFKSCDFSWGHVFIDGVIYWSCPRPGSSIISFDLKSEKFGEVCIPERLIAPSIVKVNESLALLEYNKEGEMLVCRVWMRKDGGNKPFTKIYTINFEGKSLRRVLGFRNDGEAVMEIEDADIKWSRVEVYEPSSGRINSVGISGKCYTFTAWSYMETLLLLDQSNSIIY